MFAIVFIISIPRLIQCNSQMWLAKKAQLILVCQVLVQTAVVSLPSATREQLSPAPPQHQPTLPKSPSSCFGRSLLRNRSNHVSFSRISTRSKCQEFVSTNNAISVLRSYVHISGTPVVATYCTNWYSE